MDEDELDPLPTPWRKARSGLAKRSISGALAEEMARSGRSLSTSGRYKSAPGAPISANDTLTGLSMTRPHTGMSDSFTWNKFFAKSQLDTANRFGGIPSPSPLSAAPSLAPTVPTDARAMAETWSGLPKVPTAPDMLRAATSTISQFSERILGGAPAPAGLSFSGLKYQTPGTVGRVDSVNDLRRKPGSRWFGTV